MPVVAPAPRWARKPRSGPLQRSSASPIAATGATDGTASPSARADERQPEPAMVHGLRPACEHELGELAATVCEATQVTSRRAMLRAGARSPRPRAPLERRRSSFSSPPRSPWPPGTPRRAPPPTAIAAPKAAPAGHGRTGVGSARGPPPSRARTRRLRSSLKTAIARSAPVSASRPHVSPEVRVAQEQRPGFELLLGQRQRLALAAATRA